MACPNCDPALYKNDEGVVLLWPDDYKKEIEKLKDKPRKLMAFYESEIDRWRHRLAVARKEKHPMTRSQRMIVVVCCNAVIDVAMLLAYGAMFNSMNVAMTTCAGIAMCVVALATFVLGCVFVD